MGKQIAERLSAQAWDLTQALLEQLRHTKDEAQEQRLSRIRSRAADRYARRVAFSASIEWPLEPIGYVPDEPITSEEYIKSQYWLRVIVADTHVFAGHAERTGVTSPGYPDRPVYRLHVRQEHLSGLYVLDGGKFWPVVGWHTANKSNAAEVLKRKHGPGKGKARSLRAAATTTKTTR